MALLRLGARLMAAVLIPTLALGANPLFLNTGNADCGICLDETFKVCPGHYRDASYAECMCGGEGGSMLEACISKCDTATTKGRAVLVPTYEAYCGMYFDDFCGSGSVAVSGDTTLDKPVCLSDSSSTPQSTTGSGGSSQTSSTSSAPTSQNSEPTDNNQGNQTGDNAGSSGRITTAPMGLAGAMLVLGVYLS